MGLGLTGSITLNLLLFDCRHHQVHFVCSDESVYCTCAVSDCQCDASRDAIWEPRPYFVVYFQRRFSSYLSTHTFLTAFLERKWHYVCYGSIIIRMIGLS